MRVRVKPAAFAAFLTVSFIVGTFADLAGPLSAFVAVFPPALALVSWGHLILSWRSFSFHQEFSTDHPQKGETVRYGLHGINEGFFPLAPGECGFSRPGPREVIAARVATPAAPGEEITRREDIHCPWRGTYVIGLTEIRFRDALSMVEIAESTEPRTFYVYPELVNLDPTVTALARSSGGDRPAAGITDEDASIFEYVAPLRGGETNRRIAWKRWAATGTPAQIVSGRSSSSALRLVLDLRPCSPHRPERLQAEDLATSAVFSVLREFARQEIPVEFILGGDDSGILIDCEESFLMVFDSSTNIIFSDQRFPSAAFTPGAQALLITTRDLAETDGPDLFSYYEETLARGWEPHILVCPPPGKAEETRRAADALAERRTALGAQGLLAVAAGENGAKELVHVLKP